jgi:hypothetical protein
MEQGTLGSTSLIPSTATHLRHLWHLPSDILDFSVLEGFERVVARKAIGGKNGRAVTAEMPGFWTVGITHEKQGSSTIPWRYCKW